MLFKLRALRFWGEMRKSVDHSVVCPTGNSNCKKLNTSLADKNKTIGQASDQSIGAVNAE